MLVRHVVIPVSADQLWDALTKPDSVAAWFGSQVEWDLRPGGQARFLEEDGTARGGVIVQVLPGRHLSFRWWPEDEGPDAMSEVSYDLEPDEEGTKLTVTEEPAPAAPPPTGPTARAVASAATGPASWSDWDTRLFECWAILVGPGAGGAEPARLVATGAGVAQSLASGPGPASAGRSRR